MLVYSIYYNILWYRCDYAKDMVNIMEQKIKELHRAALSLGVRSDKYEKDALVNTFVNVGSLIPTLMSENNHILFGRRGTGKTHVLHYLKSEFDQKGHCAIYIDLRNIGSSGSILGNHDLPEQQRVIRLFLDVMEAVHDQIADFVTQEEKKETYLMEVVPLLQKLEKVLSEDTFVGSVRRGKVKEIENSSEANIGLSFSEKPSINVKGGVYDKEKSVENLEQQGAIEKYINFNDIVVCLRDIIERMRPSKMWLLIDEYSELPSDLQIPMSDILRHVFAPLKNLYFKIAALEHRSRFYERTVYSQYVGLELGADVNTCDLDEYMVFSNNKIHTLTFFRDLFFRHINYMLDEDYKYQDQDRMIKDLFTNEDTFCELVLAAEGVPRDAFNILQRAESENFGNKISMESVRTAARKWYSQDKESAVNQYKEASDLLYWIIENVINQRKARAFLLRNDRKFPIIDFLYDARLLHIIKRNISSHDTIGIKYNAYAIDYGCYVHLINTKHKPNALLIDINEDGSDEICQVPKEDYRSIRRAVLKMEDFESWKNAQNQ